MSAKTEYWSKLISEFKSCDESVAKFCKARGLSEASFYKWRQKLASAAFVPVAVDEGGCGDATFVLQDGTTLYIPLSAGPQWLARCLQSLSEVRS
jgi:hypothetical protein